MQLGTSVWAFQNIFLNLSNISGHILCSDEWKSLHSHDELDTFTEDIKSGKCVVSQVYENQRYVLGQGWSALNLLPTDYPSWSDESGSQNIDRDLIKVPSVDWVWTGDWAVRSARGWRPGSGRPIVPVRGRVGPSKAQQATK